MTHKLTVVNTSALTNEFVEILEPEEVTLKNGSKRDFEIPTFGALILRTVIGAPASDMPDPHILYDSRGRRITPSVEVKSIFRYDDGSVVPSHEIPENYRPR